MQEGRGADGLRSWAIASDEPGRIYDEEREEIRTTMEPYKWYPQRAGRVDLILERARVTGKINDPVLRQEIAKVLAMAKAAEWTARRAPPARRRSRGGRRALRAPSASWRPASSPGRRLACIRHCWGRMRC